MYTAIYYFACLIAESIDVYLLLQTRTYCRTKKEIIFLYNTLNSYRIEKCYSPMFKITAVNFNDAYIYAINLPT
jgi:hypothetical protein